MVLKVTFHISTTFVVADQILLFQGGKIFESLRQRHRGSLGSSVLAVMRSIVKNTGKFYIMQLSSYT